VAGDQVIIGDILSSNQVHNGANVIAIDPKRGTLFIGTGNNYTVPPDVVACQNGSIAGGYHTAPPLYWLVCPLLSGMSKVFQRIPPLFASSATMLPRKLQHEDLIDKVETLFTEVIRRLDVPDQDERIRDFKSIVAGCHAMRKYRNNLLHSAFIELKAGGEIVGIVRSNPKSKTDPTSGDPIFDEEALTEEAIGKKLQELGRLAYPLSGTTSS
jgi:hypothetical protein